MKLLVLGGGGQLGSKIMEVCGVSEFDVFATYVSRCPDKDPSYIFYLDKTARESVLDLVRKVRPDAVIDTAALHNVDFCETHREEAWATNVSGTRNVAEACKSVGAKMVFVSTDFIFDGVKGNYGEDDVPNPINYYGLTKLEGEKAVHQTCENYLIVRPSVIYSWFPQKRSDISSSGKPLNFVMWVIQKLSNQEPIRIVNDQYASPTLADNLAESIIKAVEKDGRGIYHISGKTRLNRYEFTMKMVARLDLNTDLVTSISSQELKQATRRPMDSSLRVSKAEKDLGLHLLEIDEALRFVADQVNQSVK